MKKLIALLLTGTLLVACNNTNQYKDEAIADGFNVDSVSKLSDTNFSIWRTLPSDELKEMITGICKVSSDSIYCTDTTKIVKIDLLNVKTKQVCIASTRLYDKTGTELNRFDLDCTQSTNWDYLEPNSIGSVAINYILN